MIHGRKSQDEREASINGFRNGKFDILVATDVAGRGIDIAGVTHVFNYDMPASVEAYTHRIGRTGRAGKKGDSITFLTHGDSELFFELRNFLEKSKAAVPPELKRHEASRRPPAGDTKNIVH